MLTELRNGDADALLLAARDAETARRFEWDPADVRPERATEHIARTREWWRAGMRAAFAVRDDEAGSLIGTVEARYDANGCVQMSWMTVPNRRRQGVARRAIRALCQWCYSTGMTEVWATVEESNLASLAVAEAAGFAEVDRKGRCVRLRACRRRQRDEEARPSVGAEIVLEAVSVFRSMEASVWVGGGWGVDALLGEQTREHADLDVCFDAQHERVLIRAFGDQSYTVALDDRPTRFVLMDPQGHQIDMHPVRFDGNGVGVQLVPSGEPFLYPQDAFAEGVIDGRKVPCLSAAQQVRFHSGYTPQEKDRRNMAALRTRFSIELPAAYS